MVKTTGGNFLAGLLETGLNTHPESCALQSPSGSFSFRELEHRSDAVCDLLMREYSVKPGDRVVALAVKAPEIVIAALAIWKAGAIYVPVDCQNAIERTDYILGSIEPALIISNQESLDATSALRPNVPRLSYERIRATETAPADAAAKPSIRGSDYAIIIHTSGSTGFPKGAVLTHESVAIYFRNHNEFLLFDEHSRGMSNGPFHFDVSIQDTFLPLYFGASVLMHHDLFVSSLMIGMVAQMKITHLIAVSSVLDLISRDAEKMEEMRSSSLRVLVTGGEVCDPKLINRWLDTVPGLRVLYGYGPTECNSLCMTYHVREPDRDRQALYSIGKPFTGMKAVLLDDNGEVVREANTVATLAMAGPQLMEGYWRDPEQTAKVFRTIGGERYYVTGDRCYRDEDGFYYFAGRTDTEVKIRGRRINLNEVRNAMLCDEQVRYAAVGTVEVEGEKKIVAFAQVKSLAGFSFQKLEATLAVKVPDYMAPSYLCVSEEPVKTSTDKISERLTMEKVAELVRQNPQARHLRMEESAAVAER